MRPFDERQIPSVQQGLELEGLRSFVRHSKKTKLDFELGCGVGVFALRYAHENPDRFLLAVEKTREKFRGFEQRIAHHEARSNLYAFHGNAISVLTHEINSEALERIFLWYPNPYPEKQRFVRTPFFGQLLSKLKPAGRLYFASNIVDYVEEQKDRSIKDWELRLLEHHVISKLIAPDFKARTLFEKKYLARGETVHELIFEKPLSCDLSERPVDRSKEPI